MAERKNKKRAGRRVDTVKDKVPITSLLGKELSVSKKSRIDEIYALIKKGKHVRDIEDDFIKRYNITPVVFKKEYYVVKRIIEDEVLRDIEVVITDHMRKYEKIYQTNKVTDRDIQNYMDAVQEIEEAEVKGETVLLKKRNKIRENIIFRIGTCVQALHKKERVMGIHHKRINIQVNNINRQVLGQDDTRYNLSALTQQEKIEFLHLLQKTRNDHFYSPILIKNVSESSLIEDIDYEEIDKNTSIIDEQMNKQTEVVSRIQKEESNKDENKDKTSNEVAGDLKAAILRKIQLTYAKQDQLRKEQKEYEKAQNKPSKTRSNSKTKRRS